MPWRGHSCLPRPDSSGRVLFSLVLVLASAVFSQTSADYSQAMQDVKNGRYAAAIPLLEKILATTPGDLKARNLLGIALLSDGRKEQACAEFEKALAIDPRFTPALKNLAVNEMALGRTPSAAKHFEQLLKLAPDDPVGHLYMGEIRFSEKRYPDAAAEYERSGGLHLRDPKVAVHYAQALLALGRMADAERAIEQLPADAAQFHFEAGLALAAAKRYESAARQFQLAPEYPDAYQSGFNLALVWLEGGNFQAAIETGERLARSNPKAELDNLLARAYEAAGQTQKAYDALREATRLDPHDERNYLDLMVLCLTHENWDLAVQISDVALANLPSSYRVRLQRGAVFAMQGKLEDAGREFQTAVHDAPDLPLPAVALAIVLIEAKHPDRAAEILRPRRGRGTKDYLLDWCLGEALMQLGAELDKEAMEVLAEASQVNSSAATPHTMMGKLLARRGDTGRAIAQFEQALKLSPDDHTAAYQLAMLYRKTGNTTRAQALLEKVGNATSVPDATVDHRDLVRILREGK